MDSAHHRRYLLSAGQGCQRKDLANRYSVIKIP